MLKAFKKIWQRLRRAVRRVAVRFTPRDVPVTKDPRQRWLAHLAKVAPHLLNEDGSELRRGEGWVDFQAGEEPQAGQPPGRGAPRPAPPPPAWTARPAPPKREPAPAASAAVNDEPSPHAAEATEPTSIPARKAPPGTAPRRLERFVQRVKKRVKKRLHATPVVAPAHEVAPRNNTIQPQPDALPPELKTARRSGFLDRKSLCREAQGCARATQPRLGAEKSAQIEAKSRLEAAPTTTPTTGSEMTAPPDTSRDPHGLGLPPAVAPSPRQRAAPEQHAHTKAHPHTPPHAHLAAAPSPPVTPQAPVDAPPAWPTAASAPVEAREPTVAADFLPPLPAPVASPRRVTAPVAEQAAWPAHIPAPAAPTPFAEAQLPWPELPADMGRWVERTGVAGGDEPRLAKLIHEQAGRVWNA